MVIFFKGAENNYYAVGVHAMLHSDGIQKLRWLFGDAEYLDRETIEGIFVGPRKEMITPWSTNAVEITQNMGINGISRIEELFKVDSDHANYDRMLQSLYNNPDQLIYTIDKKPEPLIYVSDLTAFNQQEGLA